VVAERRRRAGREGGLEELSRYNDEAVVAMRESVVRMIPRFLYRDPIG
jgi:hypothetical protein